MGVYGKTISMNLVYNDASHFYQAQEVRIEIDEELLIPEDMPAIIIEERAMLPMRQITEALGCEVTWNENLQQIYVMNQNDVVIFEIDKKIGYKNGIEFTMDVPAMLINNRTMLPVRALSDILGFDIMWDDANRTVKIKSGRISNNNPTNNPENVMLEKIRVPLKIEDNQVFTIQADRAIVDYEEFYEDKKIILNLYDVKAKNDIENNITVSTSSIVSSVQIKSNDQNGKKCTQVLFNLRNHRNYTITQSEDKTEINVIFNKIAVQNILVEQKENNDRIIISASGGLDAHVFQLSSPKRIVIDIPNAELDFKKQIDYKNSKCILDTRLNMFTETTLRLVFEIESGTSYEVNELNNSLIIDLYPMETQDISYDKNNNILYFVKKESFNLQNIRFEDHYLEGYYDIILPGDFKNLYPNCEYEVNDELVQKIGIITSNEHTIIRFYQNQINAYEFEEQQDMYKIIVKNPKEVYKKIVLLDAGHGGKDPGASANGLVEKNLNLQIVQKIAKYLEDRNIKVYLTRNADVYPENLTRANTANQIADIMVSIHMNSGPITANGTEVLYQIHSNDDGSKLTSKQLAETLQSHIITATGNRNRGAKLWEDVLILNRTVIPTALIEVGFITNVGDAAKLSSESYQNKVAQAIADGIIEVTKNYNLR